MLTVTLVLPPAAKVPLVALSVIQPWVFATVQLMDVVPTLLRV